MKYLLITTFLILSTFVFAQREKNIILNEQFKDLKNWKVESSRANQFTIKQGSLWMSQTPILKNKGSNDRYRIYTRLKNKLACSFQIDASFSSPKLSVFDTSFILFLSSNANNPLIPYYDYMHKYEQSIFGLYIIGSGYADSVDIKPLIIHDGIKQNMNSTFRMRIPIDKIFDLTVQFWYNEQVNIELKENFSKYTYKTLALGLSPSNIKREYEYINIINVVSSHFKDNYTENKKAVPVSYFTFSNLVVDDKFYFVGCTKPKPVEAKPNINCTINYNRLEGANLTGEKDILKVGDAYCKLGDKIMVNTNVAGMAENKVEQTPYIITIVSPDTKNILIKNSTTNFIADQPGVYTIITSFNKDAGSCGTFSKFLNVADPITKKENEVQIEAYFDSNCNGKKDNEEPYISNYTLTLINLQNNETKTYSRLLKNLVLEMSNANYEILFKHDTGKIVKAIKKTITVSDETKLIELVINNCETNKKEDKKRKSNK
jgi:plasmid maintenance system antidote protein VapI